MRVVAFLTEHVVVDWIIGHLKLTFAAERPPPPAWAFRDLDMVADPPVEYFPRSFPCRRGEVRSVYGFIDAGVGRLDLSGGILSAANPI